MYSARGWRHRCDISANKPLFPPPLSFVPNNKLHSCIFRKWQSGPSQNGEQPSSARKPPPLARLNGSRRSRLEIMRKRPAWARVCYLKCVRCLWMSRSRMGVGLEEPRGERSWLNKSWNSLQICLTDRRREGKRVYHLSATQPSQFVPFFFLIIFFHASTLIVVGRPTREKNRRNTKFCKCRRVRLSALVQTHLSGFDSVLKSLMGGFYWKKQVWELLPFSTSVLHVQQCKNWV